MKFKSDSISWFEHGRLLAQKRAQSGRSPAKKALLTSLLAVLALAAIVSIVPSFPERPWPNWNLIIVVLVLVLAFFLLTVSQNYLGRSVAATHDRFVFILAGSKIPKWIKYDEIRTCTFKQVEIDGQTVDVLDVVDSSGGVEESELPPNSDLNRLASFLEARHVSVSHAA